MVRDNRRDASPLQSLVDAVLSRLRGLTATSGGGVALLAGLVVPVAGRLVNDLFSRGSVGFLRKDAGLWEMGLLIDETEATRTTHNRRKSVYYRSYAHNTHIDDHETS